MPDHAARWILKRNCSASPKQLAAVFASLAAFAFLIGVVFAAHGAWLVVPFAGLEVVAVAAAFLCYGRHAADYETIELRGDVLTVERVDGDARTQVDLPARWAGVEYAPPRLIVYARGKQVEVGRHLPEARRSALAREIKSALLSQRLAGASA
ncbi:MAG TPA: DUF2244 domain-containing protein [Burkholderiaceae bacterium]|nr:DUF2244 domain-containing protein [Burkholderiaceae bacterium]